MLQLAAVLGPALVGAISAIALGYRQVRELRRSTGDDSALTNVLSGEAFRNRGGRRSAA